MSMSQNRARRSRQEARRSCRSRPTNKRDVTLRMLRDVGKMETTLALEWWVSWLFGEMWRRRGKLLPVDCEVPWELALGAPIVDDMAAVGGRNAWLALRTIARFDRGELGWRAFELASELCEQCDEDFELPDHVRYVGRATITQAAVTPPDPDGEVVFVESRAGDEDPSTVAVFIDARRGGIAKALGLVRGLDEIAELERREHGGRPNRLNHRVAFDPTDACGTLREALQRTDLLLSPPVDDTYISGRAFALSRACSLA